MSTRSVPLPSGLPQPQRPTLRILKREPLPRSVAALRVTFWTAGILLASAQAWIFRYQVSADSISYLDMSDAVLPGSNWHRLINGVWSPLYPFLLGMLRRMFHISPGNEIMAGHLLNLAVFIFAFACFEFFLSPAIRELEASDDTAMERRVVALPKWGYLPVAYSLFLWAAIEGISLRSLRPDMLMSGCLYLAVGMLLRMHRAPASWSRYLELGAILGIGFLAKAPMLPIGVLVLAATFFVVESWRPALKMAAGALALMLLIGSLYFLPLSGQRGHFTLGESAAFNYVMHVDGASPQWYLQDPGNARGSFLRPPEKVFSDPPAYAFALPTQVTHPLRFDPSYWLAGVHPHFALKPQLRALAMNLSHLQEPLRELRAVVGAVFVLAFLCTGEKQVIAALMKTWPLWLIGLAGCLMYAVISVEPRYVAAFLALFWSGLILGFPIPQETGRKIAMLIVIATIAGLLFPAFPQTYVEYAHYPRSNADFDAARSLSGLGIKPGDWVARISPLVSDLGMERILRVEVAAEVDHDYAAEFWDRPWVTQQALLRTFVSRGVKAVIATSPKLSAENQAEWRRLGLTQYWVWRPNSQ